MNQEIKEKWIQALKSGEYEQCQGFLRIINTKGELEYCCLGVLCDIYAKENNIEWKDNMYGEEYSVLSTDIVECNELPEEVAAWAGCFKQDPSVIVKDTLLNHEDKYSLTYLNDTLDMTFEQISNFIEQL